MRGLVRQKQSVYWSRITEELDGIDTAQKYQNPELHKLSVSATAGTSEELASGYVPKCGTIRNFKDRFGKWLEKLLNVG